MKAAVYECYGRRFDGWNFMKEIFTDISSDRNICGCQGRKCWLRDQSSLQLPIQMIVGTSHATFLEPRLTPHATEVLIKSATICCILVLVTPTDVPSNGSCLATNQLLTPSAVDSKHRAPDENARAVVPILPSYGWVASLYSGPNVGQNCQGEIVAGSPNKSDAALAITRTSSRVAMKAVLQEYKQRLLFTFAVVPLEVFLLAQSAL